jgi:hypothetical protein
VSIDTCIEHWLALDAEFWREERKAARSLLDRPSIALPSIQGRTVSVYVDPDLTRFGRSQETAFERARIVLAELGATARLVETPCSTGFCLNLMTGYFTDLSVSIPSNTIAQQLALTNVSAPEGSIVVPVSLTEQGYAMVGRDTNAVFCAMRGLGGHPLVDDIALARCIYGGFAYPCSVGCQFPNSDIGGSLFAARSEGRVLCPAA